VLPRRKQSPRAVRTRYLTVQNFRPSFQ
jgi:hypothetical protein